MEKEDKLEERGEKFFKRIFKDPWLVLLVIILILGSAVRIYYINIDQAAWWDAADYLSGAKVIGGRIPVDYNYEFNPRRPFFLPLLWGGLYRLGFDELAINITELLFSIAAILLVYLVGKEMYDKKVGVIAAFGMAVYWEHIFYTPRFMTEVPATALWLAMVYFFWKGYVKKEKPRKNLLLAGVFAGWGFFTRLTSILFALFLLLFLLITDKLKFLKNKNIWLALLVAVLIMTPFLIYTQVQGGGLAQTTRLGERYDVVKGFKGIMEYVGFFYNIHDASFLFLPFFILFLFGLIYLLVSLILGFDLLIKGDEVELKKIVFLFLWILVFLVNFGAFTGPNNPMQPRYLMYAVPAMMIIVAVGSLKIYDFLKKYNKYVAVGLVSILIIAGGYYQLNHAVLITKDKQGSYYAVKQAGLWLKENSNKNAIIVSESIYQNLYYSERNTYLFNKTEEEFNQFVRDKKPDFMVISVFEPYFTPEYVYTWAEKHQNNIRGAKAYYADPEGQQALLVVYQFISYDVNEVN